MTTDDAAPGQAVSPDDERTHPEPDEQPAGPAWTGRDHDQAARGADAPTAATAFTTGAGSAEGSAPLPTSPSGPPAEGTTAEPEVAQPAPPAPSQAAGQAAPTTVLPGAGPVSERRDPPEQRRTVPPRPSGRPQPRGTTRRARRARLVVQRIDPWSVFLFSLVASICLGIVLLVAVAALYSVLSGLGVLSSVNDVLGEVLGDSGPGATPEPVFTLGRVLGATAVLAAVDVVLLTVLATLGALLYNLCASLTGGIEVLLGERD